MRLVVSDYMIEFKGQTISVDGPANDVCWLVGERLRHVITPGTWRQWTEDEDLVAILGRVCGIPPARSPGRKSIRPATDRQREFAESIGYELPTEISFDAISILLTEYDLIKAICTHVWKIHTGQTLSESCIPHADTGRAIQWILNDRAIIMEAHILVALCEIKERPWPQKDAVYEKVWAVLKRELADHLPKH